MKRIALTICLVMVAVTYGQDKYTIGMQKAFELWGAGKTLEASNMFERIATVETDNWLPFYYVAQVNTVASFGLKDAEKLKQQLDKAREYTELAKAISPNNPEIMVQEAMVNTAWVAFDGATYGMKYGPINTQLYQKALALAPENPRVVFSKAEWDMGSARYFGKDIAPYCAEIAKSIPLFDNFKNETPFYPQWGKDRALEQVKQCESQ